jgi:hypothetical protein
MTSSRTWNGDIDSVLAAVNNHRSLGAPPEGEPGDKLRTRHQLRPGARNGIPGYMAPTVSSIAKSRKRDM